MLIVKSILVVLCAVFTVMSSHAITFIDPDAQTSWLGRGVQSSSGLFKNTCVRGDWVEFNNQSINLGYQDSKTASQSLREMSGRVGASVNLGLFGGGVSVNMHTRLQENNNTASVVFRLSYKSKQVTLQNRSLTAVGQGVVGQTPSQIEAICGDQYIDHVQLGNELYFVTQMVFDSKEDYEKFITQIKVRVLFFKKTFNITDEFYQYAQNGRYSIKALSPNPLPQTIIDAVGHDGEMNCTPSSAAAMDACVVASNTIMNYLLDVNGYKRWLTNENNLGVNYFSSSDYGKTGHAEYEGVIAQDVSDLLSLQTQLRNGLMHQYGLKNIIKAYAQTPATNQQDYHALLLNVERNITVLESATNNCKGNPVIGHCQTVVNDALAELLVITL